MDVKEFSLFLEEIGACSDARLWAEGKSLAQVWEQCGRGDWLLWLCGRMADKDNWPTRKEVVLAACACAETALKYVKAGEERPRIAIEMVRKWVRGEATLEEVRNAADAAAAASDAAAYAYAAADAAASASYDAAAAAADAAAYAYAAADAADAAYAYAYASASAAAAAGSDASASASAAGGEETRLAALKQCADIVRTAIKLPMLQGVSA